jgi:peptide-methionine (S)-S-oxide reductase
VGNQYRSAIFCHTTEQWRLAEQSKGVLQKTKPFRDPIVTEIVSAGEYYPAEEYHTEYLWSRNESKIPRHYCNNTRWHLGKCI